MKRVEEERDAVVSALTAQHEAAEAAAKQVGRVATQHTKVVAADNAELCTET